ncbi:MAG: Stk1 family PASTA domain-containing Ser/Thr kinase [Lachnospiraceae bacterium]|nr:Stk1 family PASTA domain-containing Ser/Thr kinase [Lachnospiraceae bacterium]
MVKIGMIIGDRYEILEKIGTGGMSDVYKAKCHKLNRFVAVKVLKQEFSENANFVSKFRIEAQAAAGLSHPNIVNVYDVGEENGIYYIVMELVEGITLKKYIEKKARLSVKEAISITIPICMGIEAAHNNHIIHRDIKPQNIIISKDGKVKVTDFGIAKAATSNTITSNVMGSVHYTSPEQARGGFSDEKSDIYSLGITLFEMLTGRVAFNGETTVAIAIKHIQEDMPSPREYVAEIPLSVEQIVFKCCQKSPDRRYQSMAELINDLKKSLMNPDEDFVKLTHPDEDALTRPITGREVAEIKKSRKRELNTDMADIREEQVYPEHEEEYSDDNEYDYEDDNENDDYDEDYDDYDDEEDYNPKMEKVTTVLAIIAAVLIGCVVLFVAGQAFGLFSFDLFGNRDSANQNEEIEFVTMVNVVGMREEDAKRSLIELGLTPEIELEESTDVPEGRIIKASARAGDRVRVGNNVILTVSIGSEGVLVPDLFNKTIEEAIATLNREGFTYSRSDDHDDIIAAGYVYKQSPEGNSKAAAGAMINLWVSLGPEEKRVEVPNLIGLTEQAATAAIIEAGLKLGNVSESTTDNENLFMRVNYQSISVGVFVDADTEIDFHIATGITGALYSYIDSILPPSYDEDPDFKSGTNVRVIITTTDEVQLHDNTTTLPTQVNFSNIKSAHGFVTLRYVNQIDAFTITHEDGTVEEVPARTESKEIVRPVEFIQQ